MNEIEQPPVLDVLRRVDVPSGLGAWSYEPVDTKLARETRAGTILQLCTYCEMLAAMPEDVRHAFRFLQLMDRVKKGEAAYLLPFSLRIK